MRRPKLSVLIPTWNRGKLLRRALETVYGQTMQDFEVVVWDDGSDDGTKTAIADYRRRGVRYCRGEKTMGVAHARNQLLDLARSDICIWQDSDDLSNKWRFEIMLQAMEKWNPPFARSAYSIFNKQDTRAWKRRPEVWRIKRHAGATAIFSRSKMGRYDEKIDCGGEDTIWELEAVAKHGTGIMVPYRVYVVGRGIQKRVSKWHNWKTDAMKKRVRVSKARLMARRQVLDTEVTGMGINAWNRCERVPSDEFTVPFETPEAEGRNYGLTEGAGDRWRTSGRCERGTT